MVCWGSWGYIVCLHVKWVVAENDRILSYDDLPQEGFPIPFPFPRSTRKTYIRSHQPVIRNMKFEAMEPQSKGRFNIAIF